jgi:hypothetical protein
VVAGERDGHHDLRRERRHRTDSQKPSPNGGCDGRIVRVWVIETAVSVPFASAFVEIKEA